MSLDDSDSPADYGIVVWLLFVSIILLMVLVVLIKKRDSYASLRYKQPFYIYSLIVFGIIASWSVFVSNDHLSALDSMREVTCSFWSYWMSHVFGINMWFTIITIRLLDKMFIFHPKLSYWKDSTKFSLKVFVFFACVLIPFILATNVTWFNLSRFDEVIYYSCESATVIKITLIIWYSLCYIIFNIMFLFLERDIHNAYFTEYLTLNHIIGVAQYVFITNICINLFGIVHYNYGRFVYTFNVSFLFLFTVLRMCGYAVYKALRNDVDYEKNNVVNFMAYDKRYATLSELSGCKTLLRGYFRFAQERVGDDGTKIWNLNNLIECINEIEALKDSTKRERKQNSILVNYFSPAAIYNLHLNDEDRSRVVLSGNLEIGKRFVFEKLSSEYFGQEYLDIVNDDSSRMFHQIQIWTHPRRHARKPHKAPYDTPSEACDKLTSEQKKEQVEKDDEFNDSGKSDKNRDEGFQKIPLKENRRHRNAIEITKDMVGNHIEDIDSNSEDLSNDSDENDDDDLDLKFELKNLKNNPPYDFKPSSIKPFPTTTNSDGVVDMEEDKQRVEFLSGVGSMMMNAKKSTKKTFDSIKSKLVRPFKSNNDGKPTVVVEYL